ncbi:hypothetical protein SAMN04487924_1597 [Bacteroides xylanisolvens]|uniref:Uncharacterized protein n=1 Tax=Bacteroides xylanisolvens TaxID=371601 RepID=A0A1H4HEF7_9BACE|nr:hypothetical protein SAMN04487924_1597 [Bacteroides xylanisolvens]
MGNEFTSLSQEIILKSLDWAYSKAINGVPGLDSAQDIANDFSRLSLKPWGIALKFLFLHHENILFPND